MSKSAPRSGRLAVILAAGESTRFKSRTSKVLHRLSGKPLLMHILDRLEETGVERVFLVVGPRSDGLRQACADRKVEFVEQHERLGTGHALQQVAPLLKQGKGSLLVVYGDTPLIRSATLARLCRAVEERGEKGEEEADQAILTAVLDDPFGYGRIVRDEDGRPLETVEERDATPQQRQIREINAGFYCFRISALLPSLSCLDNRNQAKEYYLTDLLKIMRNAGRRVSTVPVEDASEIFGINDRRQLAQAEAVMQASLVEHWLRQGVTMIDPSQVYIESGVELSPDVVLWPGVILRGATRIGENCEIHAHCQLVDAVVEEGSIIDQSSVIRDSRIGPDSRVGPFAHLRNQARTGRGVRIGNFVEIKKSSLDDGAKAAHLTYLGDAQIGKNANIGAGTITCNYDGVRKHKTVIEDGVFIGSNSQLIAPVTIGRNSYVAAGSTIVNDVPPDSLSIARSRQVIKAGWLQKRGPKTE